MDHAQSEEEIIAASEYPFDSIMVDMSHYEKEDNLEKTERITKMLHAKGIATEAEPGRINGGEDGVADTGDLEGLLTDEVEAKRFVDTGIDFLAPAFGNVHGNYGGVENIKLDFERYAICSLDSGRVMYGKGDYGLELVQRCLLWIEMMTQAVGTAQTGYIIVMGLEFTIKELC